MEYKDYYKTLGVPRTATPTEIKKAYRKLAQQCHPDRNPGDKSAEGKFKEINEAHQVLADPQKRQQYDMLGANWEQFAYAETRGGTAGARGGKAGARGGAGAGAADPFGGNPFGGGDPFAEYARAGGAGPGNVRYEFHGDQNSFSDFFRMFFGGAAPESEPRQTRATGRTQAQQAGGGAGAAPSFDDLFAQLHTNEAGATGTASRSRTSTGGRRGEGQTVRQGEDVEVEIDLTLEEAFKGSSRLIQVGDRRLEVKVPAGVDNGSKIRLRGKAGNGAGAGDLYLVTRIAPNPVFTRTAADLTREVPISLKEALLGGEVEVGTLGGKVLLKIPAGTQNGQAFRLKGKGMPTLKGDAHGDLLARLKVVLPEQLDGKQRKAAEEFFKELNQPNPRRS